MCEKKAKERRGNDRFFKDGGYVIDLPTYPSLYRTSYPSFSLRGPLFVSQKWLAVIVHDSKPGNIFDPFGHFFGHPYEKPAAYAKIGLLETMIKCNGGIMLKLNKTELKMLIKGGVTNTVELKLVEVAAVTCSFRVIFQAQAEPCNPERVVCSLFLEHSELWDEHLVDDVYNAIVRDQVCLNHMPTIDLDAFSHRGGYRV